MNPLRWVVRGLEAVRDIVGVRDARRANVRDAQIAILSQQAADRAARCAGHESETQCRPK